jgi:hypothetical protein
VPSSELPFFSVSAKAKAFFLVVFAAFFFVPLASFFFVLVLRVNTELELSLMPSSELPTFSVSAQAKAFFLVAAFFFVPLASFFFVLDFFFSVPLFFIPTPEETLGMVGAYSMADTVLGRWRLVCGCLMAEFLEELASLT